MSRELAGKQSYKLARSIAEQAKSETGRPLSPQVAKARAFRLIGQVAEGLADGANISFIRNNPDGTTTVRVLSLVEKKKK